MRVIDVAAGAGDDQRAVERRRHRFRDHARDAAAGRESDDVRRGARAVALMRECEG